MILVSVFVDAQGHGHGLTAGFKPHSALRRVLQHTTASVRVMRPGCCGEGGRSVHGSVTVARLSSVASGEGRAVCMVWQRPPQAPHLTNHTQLASGHAHANEEDRPAMRFGKLIVPMHC